MQAIFGFQFTLLDSDPAGKAHDHLYGLVLAVDPCIPLLKLLGNIAQWRVSF